MKVSPISNDDSFVHSAYDHRNDEFEEAYRNDRLVLSNSDSGEVHMLAEADLGRG